MLRFFRSLFSKPLPLSKLHVILVEDEDGLWFARGVELNYFSSGESIDEVKHNFSVGLEETLRLHVEDFGNISALIENNPKAVLEKYGIQTDWYEKSEERRKRTSRDSELDYDFCTAQRHGRQLALGAV